MHSNTFRSPLSPLVVPRSRFYAVNSPVEEYYVLANLSIIMLVDLVQTTTRDDIRLNGVYQAPATSVKSPAIDAFCLIHGTGSNYTVPVVRNGGGYQGILIDPKTNMLHGGSENRTDGCAVGY